MAAVGGASQGLGRSAAMGLAGEGSRVAICARTRELLAKTAADISKLGGDVVGCQLDLTDPNGARRFGREAERGFGRPVEILVANCGGPAAGAFGEVTDTGTSAMHSSWWS